MITEDITPNDQNWSDLEFIRPRNAMQGHFEGIFAKTFYSPRLNSVHILDTLWMCTDDACVIGDLSSSIGDIVVCVFDDKKTHASKTAIEVFFAFFS